jgi:chemotaxis protein CheD
MSGAAHETMVRIGELAVSGAADDVLVAIGLGSCIGLVVVDRGRRVAGLAHIMLPDSASGSSGGPPARFADVAIPKLLDGVLKQGGSRSSLEAVLVGGASMFSTTAVTLDIGSRNSAATKVALDALRIPIRASATGGTKGRTVRVRVGANQVVAREVGGAEVELFGAGWSAA